MAKIKIPFIKSEIIKKKADQFRDKFWDDRVPVDIEKIIDVKLQMDIIAIEGMRDDFDVDALITSDWGAIFVDKVSFYNERMANRLRFSFAHEIGHYILHKNIYESFAIKSDKDYYRFYDLLPQEEYRKLEIQAFIFAGYLLVPRDKLENEKRSVLKNVKDINEYDQTALNAYLASYLSKKFGISADAMQSIMNFDNKINRQKTYEK